MSSFSNTTTTAISTDGLANPSRVPQMYAGSIVPPIISTVFVLARLYTRKVLTHSWGHDDTFITIAWFLSLGLCVTNAMFPSYGSGHHYQFQAFDGIVPTLKLAFVARLIYQIILTLTKIGICFFYLRVFPDRTSKIFVWSLMGFVVVTGLVTELLFIFGCNPVSSWWTLTRDGCMDTNPDVIATAVVNVVADLALMAFAIPRVLPLQMHIRQKISLLIVINLGILVVAAAIVRAYLVIHYANNIDISWVGSNFTTWTAVETSTGLFCASAPTIRPLLRKIAPGFLSSLSKTYATQSGGQSGAKSKYGTGSQFTKRRPNEAFELHSQNGEDFGGTTPQASNTNSFWAGKNGDASDDDESSERGVLSAQRVNGEKNITKTVRITVQKNGSEESIPGYGRV